MKRHLSIAGRYLMGASVTGGVLYLVTTANAPSRQIWPYPILLAILIAGGAMYLVGLGRAEESTSEKRESDNPRLSLSAAGRVESESRGSVSWPNPDLIKTMSDFMTALYRTWLRAGSPSAEQIVSRSAAGVSNYQAKFLITDRGQYHTWDRGDMEAVLVALEIFGLPEELIARWRLAGARALRRQYIPRLFATIPYAPLFGALVCCGAGIAAVNLSKVHGLGPGNWYALGASSLVLLISLIWIAYACFNSYSWGSDTLARIGYTLFFISCVTGFFVGWLQGSHSIVIHHIGVSHDVLNWMIWRF